MNGQELRRTGLIGSAVALCCVTKVLILSGAVGLSALAGWPGLGLLAAFAILLGISAYALFRRQRMS